ncbi:1-phosphofructokinase [Clostridium sp. AL.422]|uniref:1-phosphofructokinase n=1 Tax=Clostridium TaxID=1485 RepID=UPI00293DFAC9|nr:MULTISPECIES: 1-phosphofructokinase [unclassified Clostridium]MDV4151748.1 1-phosphofructokinase [Clostridium sp. AL.422]
MIYTLTTNPAIDMNYTAESYEPFKVNRTRNIEYSPNGKGINVSLVLKHYGVESKALGFFGGFTGKYIVEELQKINISVKAFWIDEVTRINVFIDTEDKKEFKYVNRGPFVPKETQNDLLNYIENSMDCSYLIISGSLPQSINEDYYDELLKICNKRNIKVILDISSRKLKYLLKYEPLLIKPNNEEVKEIFGLDINNEKDVMKVLKHLKEEGAQNILLTLGEKGMYFYNGDKVYYCTAPNVNLVSSACAGDSALAAFLSEWLKGDNIEYALKKSSATGGNVAESRGIGTLSEVNKYIKEIEVREVINRWTRCKYGIYDCC